jgi:hypothetical protein
MGAVKSRKCKKSTNMGVFGLWVQNKILIVQFPEGINKKQIITSGMAPNRLLIKAFLKKAVNFESSLKYN